MSVLRPCGHLTGQLSVKPSLKGTAIAVPAGGVVRDPYDGEYEVTPQAFDSQTLNTAGKTLANDILVKPVPYYEVTNRTGGLTVNIAERVKSNA